ncbi:major facilitator superfamily domain-containing protein [Syncephalastrum racemosum]|uniref:Major facilitator superfamily domain-containing protein n=1 Tax=Syncephalastrum racemosum TaxID=13706 RepID=A0A1X2HNN5_SYNRA|nr:major facilitator superfamily domain-containing protein [Syncephalastrum racemosum]
MSSHEKDSTWASVDFASRELTKESADASIIDMQQHAGINDSPKRKFLWLVPIAQDVHPLQLFFFLFAVFTSLSVIVFVSAGTSWILTGILGISDSSGDITGSLSTYSEIMSIVAVVFWGTVSDTIEKRTVMSISLAIMGVCAIGYPFVKNVYPDALMLRLCYSIGTAGTTAMMAAMMVQVAHGKGGLVSGMIGAVSGLGAIFTAFCLFEVPSLLNKQYQFQDPNQSTRVGFGIIGGVTVTLATILWFLMPRKGSNKPRLPDISASNFRYHAVNYFVRIYKGAQEAKDPRIALAFVTSFFARADEIIITNFISLWITQYYIDSGVCRVGSSCYQAMGSTGTMTGIAQAVALVATPFFGAASEYAAKELPVIVAGIVGACGCIPFAFSIDPTSSSAMAFVVLIAIGEYGMIVSGMALISSNRIKPEIHGSVAGAYSFFGAVGIIILSKLGGKLFDVWMKGAPFLLLGIGHILVGIMAGAVLLCRVVKQIRRGRSPGERSAFLT